MPVAVPALNQFYPTVPLKELTSLYSVGGHAFPPTGDPPKTHRVAVLSYLPKTLMIHDNLPFNNKYILFVEGITQVTSVTWTVKLYSNGVIKPEGNFIKKDASNPFEFSIRFLEAATDTDGWPKFDRMVVTCTVVSTQTRTMELEHSFAKAINVTGLVSPVSSVVFAGDPRTYNFMSNQLKEYFPNEKLKWNNQELEVNEAYNENLLSIVLGIFYYNIMGSPAMTATEKSFEWQNFTRTEFVKAINENKLYIGNFRVGPGMIPLHVLNDALGNNINAVPDFTNMFNNPIYNVLTSTPPLPFNSHDPLPPDPPYVQQSKARLMGDRTRLIALFQYAMFPKSAIKLAAILVKFLWEASKKNGCNECKNKTLDFINIHLGNHKPTPDFLRNILTHYFRDPYNKIDEFAPEAVRTTELSTSPYIYSLIHNVAPRILNAYFAKRVVKKISDDYYEFRFERTDSLQFVAAGNVWVNEDGTPRRDPTSPNVNLPYIKPGWDNLLGRETFLVVETWNCKGKTVRCNIGVPAGTFNVDVSNGNMQVYMDGMGRYDIDRNFEDYSALHTAANALPGDNADMVREHLDMNHGSKFIARIKLRPHTLANFNAWTNSLANNRIELTIKTKLTDNTPCLFGNNVRAVAPSATFLNENDPYWHFHRYRVENRLVFESHSGDDPFNRLGGASRIGRVPNHFVQNIANDNDAMLPFRRVVYMYFDELGYEHYICDVDLLKPRKRMDGLKVYTRDQIGAADAVVNAFLAAYPAHGNRLYYQRLPPPPPPDPQPDPVAVLVDTTPPTIRQPQADVENNLATSRWKYYASHDNATTYPEDRRDEYDQIIVRGVHNNAIVSFQLDVTDPNELRVEIVRMPEQLHYAYKIGNTNKLIHFTFRLTWRRFANPGCFAAFIGVLAQLNYNNMLCTGMCFEDATSYPSVSHPNGDSVDTAHRGPLAEKRATVTAFRQFGFTDIISGNTPDHINDGADRHRHDHDDHLHSGGFDVDSVIDLVQ
jgi:hypothetical protein